MKTHNPAIRSPYEDGKEAKKNHDIALELLNERFKSVDKAVTTIRVGRGKVRKSSRKQMYLINGNSKNPFYVMIVSAPSNVRFESVIMGLLKQYPNYPLYILFTRGTSDYSLNYIQKVNRCYNAVSNKRFKGMVLGTHALNDSVISDMVANNKLELGDIELYISKKNLKTKEGIQLVTGITSKKQLNSLLHYLKIIGVNISQN